MVAPNQQYRSRKFAAPWHAGFLAMLPTIHAYARGAFAHLNPEVQQDLVQEVIANCLVAYVRLFRQGRVALAYPTVLARYGIAQVREGRRVGAKLNVRDLLSPYCRAKKKVVIERIDRFDEEENAWKEAVVADTKAASVPDVVSFRVDFADWLAQLSKRNRRIAGALSVGNRTSDVAKRFRLSEGRVSQLRRVGGGQELYHFAGQTRGSWKSQWAHPSPWPAVIFNCPVTLPRRSQWPANWTNRWPPLTDASWPRVGTGSWAMIAPKRPKKRGRE